MGIVVSKLRWLFNFSKGVDVYKKELEIINNEILEEEKNKANLQSQYSLITQFIVSYSRLLYVIVALVFFFSTMPSTFTEYILLCGPLVISYILVTALKKSVKWYFDNELQRNSIKIKKLCYRKKNILSEVKERTKFKDAKEILAQYSNTYSNSKCNKDSELNIQKSDLNLGQRNKSLLDSVVNHVLGENRSNALICRICKGHNGMALEEEFEQVEFRCCHCFALNSPKQPKTPSSSNSKCMSI